jgi:hypothetical protein
MFRDLCYSVAAQCGSRLLHFQFAALAAKVWKAKYEPARTKYRQRQTLHLHPAVNSNAGANQA